MSQYPDEIDQEVTDAAFRQAKERRASLAAAPCSLLPCICGEEAELDWGGCTDWNGRSWQRVDAGCKECFRSVSIEIDSDRDEERASAHRLVGGMWNEFIKANEQADCPMTAPQDIAITPDSPAVSGSVKHLVRSHWAIPSNACWLVFDLSNGDPLSRRYVWWFETRQAARDHIAWQKKQRYSADLSPPMKFIPANAKCPSTQP